MKEMLMRNTILVICYEDGNHPTGEENNEKAIKWYEKVAEQGHFETPWGNVNAMIYDHCIYYLMNDKLIAMLWSNGAQVGDLKVIKSCNGTTLVTTGNK